MLMAMRTPAWAYPARKYCRVCGLRCPSLFWRRMKNSPPIITVVSSRTSTASKIVMVSPADVSMAVVLSQL